MQKMNLTWGGICAPPPPSPPKRQPEISLYFANYANHPEQRSAMNKKHVKYRQNLLVNLTNGAYTG